MTNYQYRSRLDNIKIRIDSIKKEVIETLRSWELIERPEVKLSRSLPALPAKVK